MKWQLSSFIQDHNVRIFNIMTFHIDAHVCFSQSIHHTRQACFKGVLDAHFIDDVLTVRCLDRLMDKKSPRFDNFLNLESCPLFFVRKAPLFDLLVVFVCKCIFFFFCIVTRRCCSCAILEVSMLHHNAPVSLHGITCPCSQKISKFFFCINVSFF